MESQTEQGESKMEDGKLKQEDEEEQVAMESWEEMLHLFNTDTDLLTWRTGGVWPRCCGASCTSW